MEEPKKFSTSEISLHSSKKDCWLVIHGKVYDVTGFLEDHPGGEEVLIHASGTDDATESFEDVGHSSTAKSMMEGYLIGVLDGYNPSDKASKASGRSVRPKSSQEKQQPAASLLDFLLPLLILGVAVGAWYMLTFKNTA